MGMKKPFPTFFHSTAPEHEYIYVSAGIRGLQFKVHPADIIGFVNGSIADLIADK